MFIEVRVWTTRSFKIKHFINHWHWAISSCIFMIHGYHQSEKGRVWIWIHQSLVLVLDGDEPVKRKYKIDKIIKAFNIATYILNFMSVELNIDKHLTTLLILCWNGCLDSCTNIHVTGFWHAARRNQKFNHHQSCGLLHYQWPTSTSELTELSSTLFCWRFICSMGEFFLFLFVTLRMKVTL